MLALAKSSVQNTEDNTMFGKILLADIGIPFFLYNQIANDSRPPFSADGLVSL